MYELAKTFRTGGLEPKGYLQSTLVNKSVHPQQFHFMPA